MADSSQHMHIWSGNNVPESLQEYLPLPKGVKFDDIEFAVHAPPDMISTARDIAENLAEPENAYVSVYTTINDWLLFIVSNSPVTYPEWLKLSSNGHPYLAAELPQTGNWGSKAWGFGQKNHIQIENEHNFLHIMSRPYPGDLIEVAMMKSVQNTGTITNWRIFDNDENGREEMLDWLNTNIMGDFFSGAAE